MRCQHSNCTQKGIYPGPSKHKTRLMLCLEHVCIANKNWNNFANMTSDEIWEERYRDLMWGRTPVQYGHIPLSHTNKLLKVLELDSVPASKQLLKLQYKKLAKKHHPDLGGSKELFFAIQNAYKGLMLVIQ